MSWNSRATRISILTSMVRVSRPEGNLRHIALGVGVLFGFIGVVMLAVRLHLCLDDACLMTTPTLIIQTISKHPTLFDCVLVFTINGDSGMYCGRALECASGLVPS